jgi:catechol 2,3-dioxygenase-like lactoylglutathione lyase family enzyme
VAPIVGIDHVRLAMPKGGEEVARGFYAGVLGMREIPKPPAMAGRGGVWFESGRAQVHLAGDDPFVPAAKAHPALMVEGLDALVARCEVHGHAFTPDVSFDGRERGYVRDPFGNRIELIEAR